MKKVCPKHEQAYLATEQCPYCEPVPQPPEQPVEWNVQCPECAIRHYTYPGYAPMCCPLCGAD